MSDLTHTHVVDTVDSQLVSKTNITCVDGWGVFLLTDFVVVTGFFERYQTL